MKSVRWGWVLLGAFVAEIIIFGIAIPIAILLGEESILYTAAPASFVATFLCGWWIAAKKAAHRRVLHGLLVGAAAMIIYVAMSLGRPEPLAFVIAHVLKLVGGAAGGFVSLRNNP
jgi:putative membrane protein (TIGR04086 family)